MGASHRVKTNKNFADMLLEVKAEGMTQMQMDASAETQMKMLRQCGEGCIKSVLKEAKDFHANALSTGQCMYTTDEGDEEPYMDADGMPITDEEACDEAGEMWIENLRGGGIDILKNAYRAFNAADGGAIKMFFTVIAQGFYFLKDKIVTQLGLHSRIRQAWMDLTRSASAGLGAYPLRTEKRSLYDKARMGLQEILSGPIESICGVLPSFGVTFIVSTEINLANLCTSAMKTLINHFMGWMKKQIKNMLRKIFEAKGDPALGKRITKVLVAPLGKVFLGFEEDVIEASSDTFMKIFSSVKDILKDLQVAKVQVRLRAIEDVAVGYCWDDMNQEIFTGEDAKKLADEQYAKDVAKVIYRTAPMVDGLDNAIEEHAELFTGYLGDAKIEDKIERAVFVASLVFDPRVANVWSSDMIDALITSVMTEFSRAMAKKKGREAMEKAAKQAKKHLGENGITTRKRFDVALEAIENEKNLTMDEIVGNHERRLELLKHHCWKDTKGAQCYSLHQQLKKAKRNMPKGAWWKPGRTAKAEKEANEGGDEEEVATEEVEKKDPTCPPKKPMVCFGKCKKTYLAAVKACEEKKEEAALVEIERRRLGKHSRFLGFGKKKKEEKKKEMEEQKEAKPVEQKEEKKEEKKEKDSNDTPKKEEAKEEKKVVKKGWFSSSDDKIKAVKAEIAHIRKLLKEAGCPKAEEMKHTRFHLANQPVFLEMDMDMERQFELEL